MKLIGALLIALVLLTGCEREADVASRNVSIAADQFLFSVIAGAFRGTADKG